jgi:hypothetical protein
VHALSCAGISHAGTSPPLRPAQCRDASDRSDRCETHTRHNMSQAVPLALCVVAVCLTPPCFPVPHPSLCACAACDTRRCLWTWTSPARACQARRGRCRLEHRGEGDLALTQVPSCAPRCAPPRLHRPPRGRPHQRLHSPGLPRPRVARAQCHCGRCAVTQLQHTRLALGPNTLLTPSLPYRRGCTLCCPGPGHRGGRDAVRRRLCPAC